LMTGCVRQAIDFAVVACTKSDPFKNAGRTLDRLKYIAPSLWASIPLNLSSLLDLLAALAIQRLDLASRDQRNSRVSRSLQLVRH